MNALRYFQHTLQAPRGGLLARVPVVAATATLVLSVLSVAYAPESAGPPSSPMLQSPGTEFALSTFEFATPGPQLTYGAA